MLEYAVHKITLTISKADIRVPTDPIGPYAVIGCRGWSERGSYSPNVLQHMEILGDHFAKLGYYWGASDYGAGGYCIKRGIQSTRELINYMRKEYGIEKFALFGVSMGGHVALIYAAEFPEDVCCVVDAFGVADIKSLVRYVVLSLLLLPISIIKIREIDALTTALKFLCDVKEEFGGNPGLLRFSKQYTKYNPIERISDIKAKLLVIHGTKDYLVPISISKKFVSKIKEIKPEILEDFIIIEGMGHDNLTIVKAIDRIDQFLKECLEGVSS